jgi:hypothetical protein
MIDNAMTFSEIEFPSLIDIRDLVVCKLAQITIQLFNF